MLHGTSLPSKLELGGAKVLLGFLLAAILRATV